MQWLALKLHSCVYPEQMQTQNDKHDPNPLLYGRRGRLGGGGWEERKFSVFICTQKGAGWAAPAIWRGCYLSASRLSAEFGSQCKCHCSVGQHVQGNGIRCFPPTVFSSLQAKSRVCLCVLPVDVSSMLLERLASSCAPYHSCICGHVFS